ncbi:MAG: valine--tRNA ligase [Chloroflexi bacterium]|nr:valine--tRNA ligase [Chloroflexota bacterium]
MSEMAKRYDPKNVEQRLYAWWEERGYFKPRPVAEGETSFVISMPPPNVTGALHMGHALTASLEDFMIRYHRMRGEPTLWVPGTDHAGIATQNVVERALEKEGLSRQDLGREKFVERVWKWREEYGQRITIQHRRLGVSCDWDRERFTFDEGLSHAVRVAFNRLYEKGLIYRGTYLVNWCPRCESAISDLEVEHEDEAGKLYTFRYPLEGGGYIPVATTRPETILGDTAVAVHPDDDRYRGVVGRTALVPMLDRPVPVIADSYVDRDFGTGALKITPGHDPNDYEVGQRHKLPIINALNEDGTMSKAAGPYAGLDRYACREKLWADMAAAGLTLSVEDHVHATGHCERCHTVVEPLISTQWFVRIRPLAEAAYAAVQDGRIRIIPERFTKIYFNWMDPDTIRDWCISRQLWWGHRIPVWYCDDCGGQTCTVADPTACAHCGSDHIHQEEDVLDTWFSSGLWPFSTLGWPEETDDLHDFYPTSVLETGYDILFFWVARMIMLGLEMTGEIPFDTVYLHGLLRDEKGRKYSKSLGNALDPLDMIAQYGTDALRFTLMTGSTPGNDMKLSETRLEANRNFANKIWNAARFVAGNCAGFDARQGVQKLESGALPLELADRWILSRHNRLIRKANRLIESYQFGEAGRQIYDFLWSEFCDWYIEMSKLRLYGDDPQAADTARTVLVTVLDRTLRLLHPFMPFVTEEIWQHLPHEGESLMIAPWPEAAPLDDAAEADMALVMDFVRAVRNARAEYDVEPKRRIAAVVAAGAQRDLLAGQSAIIASLGRVDSAQLRIEEAIAEPPAPAVSLVVASDVMAYLPLAGLVDLEKERSRLARAIETTQGDIARGEELLARAGFVAKAPAAVVQRERERLAGARERLAHLQERRAALG